MVGIFPEEWDEVALVTIQVKGGTAYQYAAIADSIQIEEGEYPGESKPSLAGGRIWKQSAQEDGTITLQITPIQLTPDASNTGLFQQWIGGTQDSTEPLASDVAWPDGVQRTRDRFIVAIMWTTDESQSSAMGATTATDKTAIRFYAKECRIISHKMTGGFTPTDPVMITVVFKYPAFNKAGTAMSNQWESTDDTDTTPLPAITYA